MTAQGDQHAYKVIFDRYQPKIYSFAAFLTHSPFLAEEITQEVFLKIWQSRASLGGIENFQAYLKTIARNTAINHFNRLLIERKALGNLSENSKPREVLPDERIDEEKYERILEEAIDSLPPQQKKVYLMHRRDGMKQEEIARSLGISLYTVKEYMKNALATIRSYAEKRLDVLIFVALQTFLHD